MSKPRTGATPAPILNPIGSTMNGFDIQAQKAAAEQEDEGTVVHIHDLNDKPMYYGEGEDHPVTITTAGVHSSRYRKIEAAQRRRPLKLKKMTLETALEDGIERAAACALGWEGFFSDGAQVECNRHNVTELYRACPWVLDQVSEAMGEHTRFSKSSSGK